MGRRNWGQLNVGPAPHTAAAMFEPDHHPNEEEIEHWTELGKRVLDELSLDIVNNAMRAWDGTFAQLPSRVFRGDGRDERTSDDYLDLARKIFLLTQAIIMCD